MATPNTSEKSNSLDREENLTRGNIAAKRVVAYSYDAATDTIIPGVSSQGLPYGADALRIISYNANSDPLVIRYYRGGLSGTLLKTTTITYDANNRIQTVVHT